MDDRGAWVGPSTRLRQIRCSRCDGSGWICEWHPEMPMDHLIGESHEKCGGAGKPCEEPGCPFRECPTDAECQQQGNQGYGSKQ
jgi:hypothetical protein